MDSLLGGLTAGLYPPQPLAILYPPQFLPISNSIPFNFYQ